MSKEITLSMLERYKPTSDYEKKNAIKEVLQEIALCCLSKIGFFDEVAFYGGTVLRLFYGLDRFSEDLDFSLKYANNLFSIEKFLPDLEREMNAFGLNVNIKPKEKKLNSPIKAAFIRGKTREYFLNFYDEKIIQISTNEVIKIRMEVDINPPQHAVFEYKKMWTPLNADNACDIAMYDEASLFAGKIHAVLDRNWQNRLKERDLYDYVFYLKKGSRVNLKHLLARLEASGFIEADIEYSLEDVKEMLNKKFDILDFAEAKKDVYPFIKEQSCLKEWNAKYFRILTQELQEA